MTEPSTKQVLAYHRATGYPAGRAREFLVAMDPLLRERVLLAAQQPKRQLGLRDPIQDDPNIGPLVAAAGVEAQELAHKTGHVGKGSCHFVWREQARILSERHGIVWFSPKEMNPGTVYD